MVTIRKENHSIRKEQQIKITVRKENYTRSYYVKVSILCQNDSEKREPHHTLLRQNKDRERKENHNTFYYVRVRETRTTPHFITSKERP